MGVAGEASEVDSDFTVVRALLRVTSAGEHRYRNLTPRLGG